MAEPEVLFATRGGAALATLNRPKALNSLNLYMVTELARQYLEWGNDPGIHGYVLKSASARAFCAGGDVKAMVAQILKGDTDFGVRLFRQEYLMDHLLGSLERPQVALLDGICMGGGAGISMHGPFQVATERTVFAMPECGIGLFPDVGASRFLSRLRGHLGAYLALTGARLTGIQVREAGLASHYVASSRLPELEERLISAFQSETTSADIDALLCSFQDGGAAPGGLLEELPLINECFGGDDVEGIYDALELRGDAWAAGVLTQLKKGSPLSQKVSLRLVREGAGKSLAACLAVDNRVVTRMVRGPSDFVEGVRALLIDRSNAPRWRHAAPAQVTEEEVDAFFMPLPAEEELKFRHQQRSKL